MTLNQIINLCEEYTALGGMVQEQLRNIVEDQEEITEQNRNALRMIAVWLDKINLEEAEEIVSEIRRHLRS